MNHEIKTDFLVKEMLTDLSRLLAFDTCFPPAANYAGFCDLIEQMSSDLGGEVERFEVPEPLWAADGVRGARVNMLLRPDIGKGPDALIYFHTDTAPVGEGWTRPALELSREGDRLYGRGAADMKGCIVAVLAALRHIKRQGVPLQFRPVLAFCTDEEGGRYPGIRYLVEACKLPEVLLNLNGSATPRIWAGCFGSLDLAITGQGKAVHSGRPDSGVNALEEMFPVFEALRQLKPKVEARISAMSTAPGEAALRSRLNVTACHSGDKGSALPGACRLIINRRYSPEENIETVRGEIEATVTEVLHETRLLDWSIEEVGHLPAVVDPDGPWTARWTHARAEATNIPVEDFQRYGSGTSSDFGWVQKAGVQHMLLGGLSRPGANVHGPDEFTTVQDLTALARSVALFLSADFNPDNQANPDERGQTLNDKEIVQ